ncbi:MAG: hypothetical protein M1826_005098 [Phylliscum demangeonii]|nr:MAG: hypothetical protein M1826_005098 [Phylliscum demangeonii]
MVPGHRVCARTFAAAAARRWQSTAAAAAAAAATTTPATGTGTGTSTSTSANTNTTPPHAKIASIVDDISRLTLLETADLVASLKTRLNIADLPTAFAAPAGATGAAAAAAAAAEEEEDAAPAKREKTLFNLKLQSFEPASKPKVIKEIKSMLGLSLVDSKKFVESAPQLMKEAVPKEEAEKIVATLKGLGAVVVME